MKIEVSIGEVIDKITILEIKEERIKDEAKLSHVRKELSVLRDALKEYNINIPEDLVNKLKSINESLWDAEDILREKEKKKEYDIEFIKYAVLDATYNDNRFLAKNEINNFSNSNIKEQKSYDGLYSAN